MSSVGHSPTSSPAEPDQGNRVGAWAPLRYRAFRLLWVAGLASNIGTFAHAVGAAWAMTELTSSPAQVALVQTALSVPTFVLALFAGALADVVDRRRLLIVVQAALAVVAAVLGIVTVAGGLTPVALLGFTLAMGAGGALTLPAWSAVIPDTVPRTELGAAVSLNAVGLNVSQAAGPALAGLVIAVAGPGWVFLLNAVTFCALIAALISWRPALRPTTGLPPEHLIAAMRTGVRYARNSPTLLVLLLRTALSVACVSAIPALLPIVARDRLGLGATGFGALAAAGGVGALAMASVLPRLRARAGPDALTLTASLTYALAVAVVAASTVPVVTALALVLAGAALLTNVSVMTATVQLVLAPWVRGRGLAVFFLALQGGLAGGAAVWGSTAQALGVSTALFVAAAATATVGLAVFPLRLAGRAEVDISPATHWRDLAPTISIGDQDGPVMITVEWLVKPGDVAALRRALRPVERQRRRDGALQWRAYEDVDQPGRVVEMFLTATWAEHERQHHRITVDDFRAEAPAIALLTSPPPAITHLIALRDQPAGSLEPPR